MMDDKEFDAVRRIGRPKRRLLSIRAPPTAPCDNGGLYDGPVFTVFGTASGRKPTGIADRTRLSAPGRRMDERQFDRPHRFLGRGKFAIRSTDPDLDEMVFPARVEHLQCPEMPDLTVPHLVAALVVVFRDPFPRGPPAAVRRNSLLQEGFGTPGGEAPRNP
jgi:hypothetical protein